MGGRWLRAINKCFNFSEDYVPEIPVQLFMYVMAYLQFVTEENAIPRESHFDEMHIKEVEILIIN